MNTEPLTTLKGIGEKTEKLFAKVGIYNLQQLLHYYPRDYDCYAEPVPLRECRQEEKNSGYNSPLRRCRTSPLQRFIFGKSALEQYRNSPTQISKKENN